MFATRRTELEKEHIRPIQVGGESFDMNTPPGGGLTTVVIVMVAAQIHWGVELAGQYPFQPHQSMVDSP